MKLPLLALALALSACASTSPQKADEPRAARKDECLRESAITGFDVLDDRYILLYGFGKQDPYLAEISPGCFDLKGTTSLAAVDGDGNGQICGYGRDSIVYRDLGRTESCRIMTLEKATEKRIQEVREKKTKKKRKVIIQ